MNKTLFIDSTFAMEATGLGSLAFPFDGTELTLNGFSPPRSTGGGHIDFDSITQIQLSVDVHAVNGGGGLLTLQVKDNSEWVDVVSVTVSSAGKKLSAITELPQGLSGTRETRLSHEDVQGASAVYKSISVLGS